MSQGNKRSSHSMKRGKNLEPIPTDLVIEILSRLNAKSIARFRCVSKLWGSIFHRPYFTELFLTRSQALPRLLFAVEGQSGEWSFYSSPQLHNPYQKLSFVVAADFQMNFPRVKTMWIPSVEQLSYRYVSGLIYFPDMLFLEKPKTKKRVIFNPSTGQHVTLPNVLAGYQDSSSFLGFDPIDKQFKVLFIGHSYSYRGIIDHRILTFGTGKLMWRKIQCPLKHKLWRRGICINGVLYYLATKLDVSTDVESESDDDDVETSLLVVCFDIRSEKFKFINADCLRDLGAIRLINYKGKLGGMSSKNMIELWLLEDAEKQDWSKHVYTLPSNKIVGALSVVGITARGDFVLAMEYAFKQFWVCYFNPERNTLLIVEIQGFGTHVGAFKFGKVHVFLDHIEDLNFNNASQASLLHL